MAVTLFRFDEDYYTSSPTMATTFGTGTPGPTYTNLVMVVMFSNSPGATSSPGAGWTLLARTETLASSNRSIENYCYGNPQYVVAEMWWSTTTSSLSGTQTGATQGSSTGAVNLRFNGNSTSGDYINGGGGSSTWLTIGSIAGSLTNTNRWGRVEAIIQNKVGTLHTVSSQYATTDANTTPPNSSHTLVAAGHFEQTAAITTLAAYPNSSTDFVAGTRFRVFGRLI